MPDTPDFNDPDRELFLISGAACSGKSSLFQQISLRHPKTRSYDFDEIRAPIDANIQWRQRATRSWLRRLRSYKGKIALFGQTVLGEVLACEEAYSFSRIVYVLLDVDDAERIKRLRKRNSSGIHQGTLNWASWLRVHCVDPQWEQDVIIGHSCDFLDFERWRHLTSWVDVADVIVVNSTHHTVANTARVLTNIIDS